jgi:acetylornithine deacetylase
MTKPDMTKPDMTESAITKSGVTEPDGTRPGSAEPGVLATSGDLSIRLMRDDDRDIEQMSIWLTDPRVLEWFEGRDQPFPTERVRARYIPRIHGEDGMRPCFIVEQDEPVGYIQFYPVGHCAAEYELAVDDADDVWAIDLFIGHPDRWGSGLGTRALSLAVDHLLVDLRARRVLIDPRVVNERAIRSYTKIGFRPVTVMAEHEVHEGIAWDCLLMEIDALDHPVGLAAHLARIDSVNPALVPGAAGERDIASAVAEWCLARGIDASTTEVAPGRFNVVAHRDGRGGGHSLVFNAHLDTVGPVGGEVRLGDGRLEGRGVLDTKGGLAAAMLAIASFTDGELAGDLILAAVADEEHASLGTDALVLAIDADAAVVLEPTDLHVVRAHRGFAVVDVVVTGRAAHTSRPDRGVNAVHAAARAAVALAALDQRWLDIAGDPILRPAALVDAINSSGETFTVPARAQMVIELRTVVDHPGLGGPDAQLEHAIAVITAAIETEGATMTAHVTLSRPPMELAASQPFVDCVAVAVGHATSREPVVIAAPYWTDAALHAATGTAAVVLGPVGEGLHEDLEWVTTDSLHRCTAALVDVARRWCGPATTT